MKIFLTLMHVAQFLQFFAFFILLVLGVDRLQVDSFDSEGRDLHFFVVNADRRSR